MLSGPPLRPSSRFSGPREAVAAVREAGGEVVAAGSGAKAEDGKVTPLDVKAGDRVLFGKWSGTEVKVGGEDLLIMKESDILGVIG